MKDVIVALVVSAVVHTYGLMCMTDRKNCDGKVLDRSQLSLELYVS